MWPNPAPYGTVPYCAGPCRIRRERTLIAFASKTLAVLKLQFYYWTVAEDGRCGSSASSTFGLVTISGCAPYAAVDVRRPSFSGRRLSSLEQFATPRHVCTGTAFFLQSSEDLFRRSLPRSIVKLVIGHINSSYLSQTGIALFDNFWHVDLQFFLVPLISPHWEPSRVLT